MNDVKAKPSTAMPRELLELIEHLGDAQKRFVAAGWEIVGPEGRKDTQDFIASGTTRSAKDFRSRVAAWRLIKAGETAV